MRIVAFNGKSCGQWQYIQYDSPGVRGPLREAGIAAEEVKIGGNTVRGNAC